MEVQIKGEETAAKTQSFGEWQASRLHQWYDIQLSHTSTDPQLLLFFWTVWRRKTLRRCYLRAAEQQITNRVAVVGCLPFIMEAY